MQDRERGSNISFSIMALSRLLDRRGVCAWLPLLRAGAVDLEGRLDSQGALNYLSIYLGTRDAEYTRVAAVARASVRSLPWSTKIDNRVAYVHAEARARPVYTVSR